MNFDHPLPLHDCRIICGAGHYDTVMQAVCGAQISVWIATANLKDLMVKDDRPTIVRRRSHRSMLEVFSELAQRNVELRILHATLPSRSFRDSYDAHPQLVQGALELRQCVRQHMKLVVVDGEFLYMGSANWTGAGLGVKASERRNFEMGIVTQNAKAIDKVQEAYDHIWRGAACGTCKRRDVCDAPLDI
jgi:phosphatidylserine/phosphatidylglycerophosphate/cardiolipin synthase-like enzyme